MRLGSSDQIKAAEMIGFIRGMDWLLFGVDEHVRKLMDLDDRPKAEAHPYGQTERPLNGDNPHAA